MVQNNNRSHVPYELASLIEGQFSGIKHVVMVESDLKNEFVLNYEKDKSIKSTVIFTDNNFNNILSFETVSSNLTNALSEPQAILLTESESNRLFADENPIGKMQTLKETMDFFGESLVEVKAVIKDLPENLNIQFYSGCFFCYCWKNDVLD